MYVCVCNAVTERQIHQAVEAGAKTVKQLKDQLGVATECASCVGCAKACIKQAQAAQQHHYADKVIDIAVARRDAA